MRYILRAVIVALLLSPAAGQAQTGYYSISRANNQASRIVQAARPEMVTVSARELYREINLVGKIEYGDGQIVHLTAPLAGRIEQVAAHSAGDRVAEGEELVSIKSDPLLDRERRLFKVLEAIERNGDSLGTNSTRDTLWAARKQLLLLGVHPNQLAQIERSRKGDGQLSVESRIDGILLETRVRAGQQVKQGDTLYQIAKPNPMWLYFDIRVRDLPWVALGRRVNVNVQATPAQSFRGLVTVVSPMVDPITQTVRIGIPLPNPNGKLRQFMAANATIRVDVLSDGMPEPTGLEGKFICSTHPEFVQDSSGDCPKAGLRLVRVPAGRTRQKPAIIGKVLAVPITAVFDRGGRKLVRRQTPAGMIEMVEIKVGPMAQGRDERGQEVSYYPVLAGLKEGDRLIVTPNEPPNPDTLVVSAGNYVPSLGVRLR